MYVFIRKAGFWNAKNYEPSSQFGHIMLCVDNNFYSFNQRKFVTNQEYGCVQVINKEIFCDTYNGEIWHIVELLLGEKGVNKVIEYFLEIATQHAYSFKNNCTLECQRALEYGGIDFPRDYLLPGSVLSCLSKPHLKSKVKSITRTKISKNLPI